MDRSSRILVAAHDTGGAQILAALMKKYRDNYQWFAYTAGPATGIFRREGLRPRIVKTGIKGLITGIFQSIKPDLVLTGTGWGSSMEFDFIQKARKSSIKSAAFLDHWCNYRERFGYPGPWQSYLPDHILVGDLWAYQIALKHHFPVTRLHKVENPYWQNVADSIRRYQGKHKKRMSSGKVKLLYLSSPIAPHAKQAYGDEHYWGTTEHEQLKDLLDIMKNDLRLELRIRLHPAESKAKYSYLKAKDAIFTDHQKTNLIGDCFQADIIIGCDSMALVTAWMMGRRAISYIPGKKLKATLPQKGIVRVGSKAALKRNIQISQKGNKIRYRSGNFFSRAFPIVLLNLN